jgi:antitoxin Phd
MASWQLQDAKARLSELVKKATTEGPQEITVHGKPAVVVLSSAEFLKLKGNELSFVDFMRSSPLVGVELDLERSKDATDRPVDFGLDDE